MKQNIFLLTILLFVSIILLFTVINCLIKKRQYNEPTTSLYYNGDEIGTSDEIEMFRDLSSEDAPTNYLSQGRLFLNDMTKLDGNPIYLDRQNVDCGPKKGIQHLVLETGHPNRGRFIYRCTNKGVFNGDRKGLSTGNTGNSKGKVEYLDRLNVSCEGGNQGLISQFQLQKIGENNMRYNYKCSPMENPFRCRRVYTKVQPRGNARYIDRHGMYCRDNSGHEEGLGRFQQRNVSNGVDYEYHCCTNRPVPGGGKFYSGDQKTTPMHGSGGGKVIYMDRLRLDCGNEPIQQLVLETDGDKQRYKYTCTKGGDMTGGVENRWSWREKKPCGCTDKIHHDKRVKYLSRIEARCDGKGLITRYRLEGEGKKQKDRDKNWRYVIGCRNSKKDLECKEYTTPWTGGSNDNNSRVLDRHNIACPADRALQNFKIDVKDADQRTFRYRFKCCKIK